MSETQARPAPLGPMPYVVAALSVFPVLGALFGLVAVGWGLATLQRGGKPVAIIGALGLASQTILIQAAFHFLT